jgi:tetratricopeptide (TPR) repeat protein
LILAIILALLCSPLSASETYFQNFEQWVKQENWKEILAQGEIALAESPNISDEAKICAQLTSTCFYMGDYPQALKYATRCHELSESFEDPSLFIRALYLESAVYRALRDFPLAVAIAEEATDLYRTKGINDADLLGKVYFNLGAAHADNPSGDLSQAEKCYVEALKGFTCSDDLIRTSIRLGKVYLLQKDYAHVQSVIDDVQPLITNERLAMHADYLEAQLKFALGDIENAKRIASIGLKKAQSLGAKQDELRFLEFQKKVG